MTPTFPRRPLALVLALAAPLGLLACSEDEPPRAAVRSESPADEGSSGSAISGGASGATSPDEDGADDDAATPPSDAPGPDDDAGPGARDTVLGSATGSHPATVSDPTAVPLRVDVHGLTRNGEVVEVLFSVTNTGSDATYELWRTLAESGGDYDASGAALVDTAGGQRYLTVLDSEGTCLCTGGDPARSVAPGETLDLQASVTAPPPEVTEVTFTLPGFDPVVGLEIS